MLQFNKNIFFLDVVVRLSLAIFFVALITLLIVILVVLKSHEGSYEDFIRSQLITLHNIQLVMLMSGLFLIIVTTLITWLIGVYSSFKVAGPLFRFSENISHLNEGKKALKIRDGDCFQELSVSLLSGIETMDAHKQELKFNIDRYTKQLNSSGGGDSGDNDKEELAKLLCSLKDVESKVKLSD